MSPESLPPGSLRSTTEVNEAIRALWSRAGGSLSARERDQYELLVIEWAAATRGDVVKAA